MCCNATSSTSFDLSADARITFCGTSVSTSSSAWSGVMSLMLHGADIQLSGLYEPSSEKISRLLSALMSSTRLASGREAFNRPEYSAEQSATIIRTRHYPTMRVAVRTAYVFAAAESHVKDKSGPVIAIQKHIAITGPPYVKRKRLIRRASRWFHARPRR